MTMPASLAGEVEEAVSGGDPRRRVDVLRRITTLFVDQAPCLQDQHVEVFDEVILRLARNLEFRARVALAEQIAALPNAPRQVVGDLARDDDLRVARPVLETSTRLSDDDLVEIAAQKGQGHLLALSRRGTLPERVTDILVGRGDRRVVRSVAGNEGARFSDGGFSQLLAKARQDPDLQAVLRARTDIPPASMKQLLAIAREKVRETLSHEMGAGAGGAIDAAVGDAALALEHAGGPGLQRGLASAQEDAAERALPEADEATIARWLREGRVERALEAMARRAKVPARMVASAYHSSNYDPLLFVTRSIGFGWGTFKLLLGAKAGRELPEAVLTGAFENFQRVSVANAARVVHFTAVRERAARGEAA